MLDVVVGPQFRSDSSESVGRSLTPSPPCFAESLMLLWSYSGSEFAALRVRPTHDPIESMMMMYMSMVFVHFVCICFSVHLAIFIQKMEMLIKASFC